MLALVAIMAGIWQVTKRMKRRARLPGGVASFLDGGGAKVIGAALLVVALGLMAVVINVVAALLTR